MKTQSTKRGAEAASTEFVPLAALLERPEAPRFPSESAARWVLRDPVLRRHLADAEAVALQGRNLMFNPERFARAFERFNIDRFKRRVAAESGKS